MTLDNRTEFNGLKVCPDCGWSVIPVDEPTHKEKCNKLAGNVATKLAESLPKISSTKLGYGTGNLSFEFDDNHSITLRVHADGTFGIESFYALGEHDTNSIRDLVQSIASWHARRAKGS